MVDRYRVAQVGFGHRGRVHAQAFRHNDDRFELVALCELDPERLERGVKAFGFQAGYRDAERMLDEVRPDIFCFVTPPNVRLSLVEMAAHYGVRGLALEKPMATSLREAWQMRELCRQHDIKAVVSHQQKYLSSFQMLKGLVDAGEIGGVREIHATSQAWLAQLGTHLTDYILWINADAQAASTQAAGARAAWVVGHVHGAERLDDSHPSPDYILGRMGFENGVQATLECGYLAPSHLPKDRFWVDNRLTVYGSHGYAWAETDGRWGTFNRHTSGETLTGAGDTWQMQQDRIQIPYLSQLADWLDGTLEKHPCNLEQAYHGYEILEGLALSALNHTRIDLPLEAPQESEDLLSRLRQALPPVPPRA
jgi:predicted dehydrogenase